MNRYKNILVAGTGVFIGSILADLIFGGDGIQAEDLQQAILVGLIAGAIQYWMSRNRT